MKDETDKKLHSVYSEYIDILNKVLIKINGFNKGLSYPLLISTFEDYFKTNKRIMFIGKETYGWWLNERDVTLSESSLTHSDIIAKLMDNYFQFNLGKQYYASPFWDFCHKFFKKINDSDSETGFIWNNISKLDQRQLTPDWEILKTTLECFPIHEKELKILNPDIIIFLTGNPHDRILETVFPGLHFDIIEPKILSKLRHPILPVHTYRTYHPKYLRINGIEKQTMDTIVKLINES